MERLNTSSEMPLSAERRVYNVGAHGGIANASINQRLMDGIDLNASIGGKRFDQHFDSNIEHSMENYSSRQYYGTGAGDPLRDSIQYLKRSETEKPQTVSFAQSHHFGAPKGNHPLHYK